MLYAHTTSSSVYAISEKYMTELLSSVKNSSDTFFSSVESGNRDIAVHYWQNSLRGAMAEGGTDFNYFRQIAQSNSGFQMVYFADTVGGMTMALAMADGSISKRIVTNDGEFIYENFTHENQEYNVASPNTIKPADQGYDPRKRGWYKNAMQNKKLSWTDIYIFNTGNQPGYSCSMPIYNQIGRAHV